MIKNHQIRIKIQLYDKLLFHWHLLVISITLLPMLLEDGLSSLIVMLQADFGNLVIKLYPAGMSGLVKIPEIKRHVLLSPPHTPHPSNLFCPPIEPSQPTTCEI